ncbi:MAG: tRNA pseudouridine(38-40) synthase TruA [Verrucomicrobia bacterium]|nr:MAG: tRNA pseudouridine(38-40) synthase TruA [Verrucomicrobiota bacterium]
MSRRLKLIVAYDGAPFAGWQSQSHRNTMQDHLERAFERVTGEAVRVHGAGRTDAGVHALAQCVHVDVLKFLAADRWIKALNASLSPAIRVLSCRYVSKDFHARLSAKGKIYRYRIWTAPVLPPFEYGRAWHVARPLNLKILKSAAKHFAGKHDFASFAANRGKPEPSTIRTINSVRVRQKGPCITIEFDGEGFLYKMVRLMVGALVNCGLGKMRIEEITSRLHSGEVGSARFAAPAEGLYLVRVRYSRIR